jgi:hypothetical protein
MLTYGEARASYYHLSFSIQTEAGLFHCYPDITQHGIPLGLPFLELH